MSVFLFDDGRAKEVMDWEVAHPKMHVINEFQIYTIDQ